MELREKIRAARAVDRTHQASLLDYNAARTAYIDLLAGIPGVCSVYQVGSVGVLGLSDIDLIVVFDDVEPLRLRRISVGNLERQHRYLLCHEPWFVSRSTFCNLSDWFPVFEAKHVYGESLEFRRSPPNVHVKLLILLQFLIAKLPSDLAIYSCVNDRFYERTMIAMINSLKHSLILGNQCGIADREKWVCFREGFERFRSNWFAASSSRDGELREYTWQAINIAAELLESCAALLRSNFGLTASGKMQFVASPFRQLYFHEEWTSSRCLHGLLSSRFAVRQYFPLEIGMYLHLWRTSHNRIGDQVECRLSGDVRFGCNEDLRRAFTIHSAAVSNYNDFYLAKFGTTGSPYHNVWYQYGNGFLSHLLNRIVVKYMF
jgi:hypothetical protein